MPNSQSVTTDRYNHKIRIYENQKTVLFAQENVMTVQGVPQRALELKQGAINVKYEEGVPIDTDRGDSYTKIFSRPRGPRQGGRRIIVRVKNTTNAAKGTDFWVKFEPDLIRISNAKNESPIDVYGDDGSFTQVSAGRSKPFPN